MNESDEPARHVCALSGPSVQTLRFLKFLTALSLTCQAKRHFASVVSPLNKAKHSYCAKPLLCVKEVKRALLR